MSAISRISQNSNTHSTPLRREPFLTRVPIHLYTLFAVLLIWPVSQNTNRTILAAVFAAISVIMILTHPKRFQYSLWATILSGVSIATGAFFCAYGFIRGNPGAAFSIYIYVMWPIFYILFSMQIVRSRVALILHRTLVACCIFLGVFVVNFLLIDSDTLPDNPLNKLVDLGQAVVYYDGYSQMRFYPISTMIFAVPYLIAYLIISYGRVKTKDWFWSLVALAFGLIIMVFSGRRALLLNTLIAPLTCLFGIALLKGSAYAKVRRNASLSLLLSAFILPITIIGLYFISPNNSLITTVGSFISGNLSRNGEGPVDNVRTLQADALLRGWRESPFIGKGLGATTDLVRSEDRPWQYELQYHLALLDLGLLGFLIYAFCMAGIFYYSFRAILYGKTSLAPYILASCVGLLSFIIANASNPYFQAFGHLYAIFLPIGLSNLSMRAVNDHSD